MLEIISGAVKEATELESFLMALIAIGKLLMHQHALRFSEQGG